LVSIIIPNYNHSLYLKQRIDSVLNQTCQDFEMIILDDCSTDNSKEVIEQYRNHQRVSHIILNEVNSGSTFKQWEKGIALAKGEWIWIAESDDWCEPTLLQELVNAINSEEEIVVAFCQSIMVSPQKKIINKTKAAVLNECLAGQEFVRKRMAGINEIVNASMGIFKKSAWIGIPKDYEQMKYCGDWLFWVQLCLQGKVFISGKYLNYYLRHENNVATKAIQMGYDFLEGDKIYSFVNDRLGLNNEEKQNALATRLDLYFTLRDRFLNANVEREVRASLLGLDPSVEGMIKKQERKGKLLKTSARVKYYLKKVLLP
jgi:glycosyltransferase involved in cell wall biosynthesis